MDQKPKSSSTDQTERIDHNNNNDKKSDKPPKNRCSCTNISIMQLFHEMKQEFPKVPDQLVQQLVTDHCHNRRACIDQLRQAATSTTPTNTMYPSKSIHNNQTPRSPLVAAKWSNNQKMKEISEKFENTSPTSSQSDSASGSSEGKLSRPTTLKLRRAPDPPTMITSTSSSTSSTPNSNTSLSKFNSVSSSASSLVSSSISSSQAPNTMIYQQPSMNIQPQVHHNVTLDSSATKYSDSLNVQLNVTVSPVSHPPPIPPRPPAKPTRHLSQLSMHPEPAFTSMLEQKPASAGGTSVSSGTTGQRSYTSVNFTLRQPTSIIPLPITPIDIQAGPSSLTYSSSSFDAKQGYQSHLTITVAGNGESCIQAVRTKQPSGNSLPEVSQIDTTISVGNGTEMSTDCEPIRITTNNQQKLPLNDHLMTEEELRRLIQKQLKQKELLENELSKEKEKLEMIRFDIITLSSPMMSDCELQKLCDEILRLRIACERLAGELDVSTAPQRSPASLSSPRPRRPPPPIPPALRCLSLQQSPFHSNFPSLSPLEAQLQSRMPSQPPSYNEVMRETSRGVQSANSLPNLVDDVNEDSEWSCSMCTFLNYPLLNQCEQCDMPRVQGIKITRSSFRPLRRENNQTQGSSANSSESLNVASNPTNNDHNSNNNTAQTATAL